MTLRIKQLQEREKLLQENKARKVAAKKISGGATVERFQRVQEHLKQQRLDKISRLEELSQDFVTPENLDAKIEECLSKNVTYNQPVSPIDHNINKMNF